jgi:Domain of unknown function (DUF222)/HNH endonuclease
MNPGVARSHVELARKLEELPEVSGAFSRGELSRSHVQVIANAYTPERASELAGVEGALVDAARATNPRELCNIVGYLTDAIDGDGGAANDEAVYARRRWHMSRTLDGMLKLDGLVDPEAAQFWEAALNAETDRVYFEGDTRLPAARRADAATNLIRRSLDTGRVGNTRAVRDRHCQAPGCDQPPERCEGHHIHHWSRGGPTNLDNLQLLCWHHHRHRHTEDAQARAAASPGGARRRSLGSRRPPAEEHDDFLAGRMTLPTGPGLRLRKRCAIVVERSIGSFIDPASRPFDERLQWS